MYGVTVTGALPLRINERRVTAQDLMVAVPGLADTSAEAVCAFLAAQPDHIMSSPAEFNAIALSCPFDPAAEYAGPSYDGLLSFE